MLFRDTFVSTLRAQGLDQAHRHRERHAGRRRAEAASGGRLRPVLAMTCLQTTFSVSKTPEAADRAGLDDRRAGVVEQLVQVFDREDVGEVALVHLDDEARAW